MKYIWGYLKQYKKEAFLAPFFKLIEAFFDLTVPMVLAVLIDKGIGDKNNTVINRCIFIMFLLAVLGMIITFIAQYLSSYVACGVANDLRKRFYTFIKKLDYESLEKYPEGQLYVCLNNDTNQVQTGINILLRLVMRSPFIVVLSFVAAFLINKKLSLIFLVTILILLVIVIFIQKITVKKYSDLQTSVETISSLTTETMKGIRVVRAFNQEESEERIFNDKVDINRDTRFDIAKIEALLNPLTFLIVNTATVILLYFSGYDVYRGSLTTGEVFALVNYMSKILVELIKFVMFALNLNRAATSANRLETIMASYEKAPLKKENFADENVPVEVRNLSYAFSNKAENTLNNISFKLNKGEILGIVGPMGSGKTTLLNFIVKNYNLEEDKVFIKGENIGSIDYKDVNNKITLVPQKEYVMNKSIRENLLMNREEDDDFIYEMLKITDAYEFVKDKGLDYILTTNGTNLSRGQRQRLSIARGLIQRPEILILDDCLTALDDRTQKRVIDNLLEKRPFESLIITSQRAATVAFANRILVMNKGEIIAEGNNDSLMETCTMYREF